MSYLVLARKWRPMRFDDLVGQEHVARTLANAIHSGRVAHAFLFTGVRGVGKTTSARILAKSLNCMRDPAQGPQTPDPGPTPTPCLKCPACLEITAGSDVDVREIDGASYNGVDEVRKLQDSLPYRPARDRYKIFIVDEVHMLSQSAWNAFLKTLEEPPPHVKFIFATTEVHKVPVTILSRVQRFDFKLIPTQLIAERLRYVLREEGIAADDGAVGILAREAAGSMRDAMSLLDQVIAYDAQHLDEQAVSRVLGVASRQVLHDIALALLQGNAEGCLEIVSRLANQGYEVSIVARDLLALLRDLVVTKVCSDPAALLDVADEERRDIERVASATEADDLLRLHQGFSQGFDDILRGPQPRAALEMLLVRLARRPPLLPIDDLLLRLGGLERRLGGGATRQSPGGAPERNPPANTAPLPGARPGQPRGREGGTPAAPRRPGTRDGSDEPPSPAAPPALVHRHVERTLSSATSDPGAPVVEAPQRPLAPNPTSAHPGSLSARADHAHSGSLAASAGSAEPAPPGANGQPVPPAAPLTTRSDRPAATTSAAPPLQAPSSSAVSELETRAHAPLDRWRQVLDGVREQRPELAAFLEHAVPLKIERDELVIAWEPGSMFAGSASDAGSAQLVGRVAASLLGGAPKITFRLDAAEAQGAATVAGMEVRAREERLRRAAAEAKQHPRIADAVEILGARLKDLKLAKE